MRIAMIAAMATNRVIGKNNQMPWHLSEDLKHFKVITLSKPVIMGRKTFESIGRPLPERRNIIISRNANYSADGAEVVGSFDDAIRRVLDTDPQCSELMVIGGGALYKEVLPKADILYLTEINVNVEGDTWFPNWNDGSWNITTEPWQLSSQKLEYRFLTAHRKHSLSDNFIGF